MSTLSVVRTRGSHRPKGHTLDRLTPALAALVLSGSSTLLAGCAAFSEDGQAADDDGVRVATGFFSAMRGTVRMRACAPGTRSMPEATSSAMRRTEPPTL